MKPMNNFKQDFQLKYENTVVRMLHTTSGKGGYGLLTGEWGGFKYKSLVQSPGHEILPSFTGSMPMPIELSAFLPKAGYYNTSTGCIVLLRKASKQWKNSYCGGIYRGYILNKGIDKEVELDIYNKYIISGILKNYYVSYTAALASSKVTALSPTVCIYTNEEGTQCVVYNDVVVGTATKKGVKLLKKAYPFKEVLLNQNINLL